MSTDFNLNSQIQDGCLILTTAGYINNTGGEKIAQEFSAQRSKGIQNVIMNLADSKVVNSIGVSYLIEMIDQLNESGGKLIFTNLDSAIDKTFMIMGLYHFAGKADSVEEALKQLG